MRAEELTAILWGEALQDAVRDCDCAMEALKAIPTVEGLRQVNLTLNRLEAIKRQAEVWLSSRPV